MAQPGQGQATYMRNRIERNHELLVFYMEDNDVQDERRITKFRVKRPGILPGNLTGWKILDLQHNVTEMSLPERYHIISQLVKLDVWNLDIAEIYQQMLEAFASVKASFIHVFKHPRMFGDFEDDDETPSLPSSKRPRRSLGSESVISVVFSMLREDVVAIDGNKNAADDVNPDDLGVTLEKKLVRLLESQSSEQRNESITRIEQAPSGDHKHDIRRSCTILKALVHFLSSRDEEASRNIQDLGKKAALWRDKAQSRQKLVQDKIPEIIKLRNEIERLTRELTNANARIDALNILPGADGIWAQVEDMQNKKRQQAEQEKKKEELQEQFRKRREEALRKISEDEAREMQALNCDLAE